MHGEDKDDRFLPKMIWFGLARVIEQDWARGLALAEKTPMPSLADSIRWFAGKSAEGREALVKTLKTTRDLKLLAFSLKDEAVVKMPKAWPQVRSDILDKSDASDLVTDSFPRSLETNGAE
jgi:hypothetical protein